MTSSESQLDAQIREAQERGVKRVAAKMDGQIRELRQRLKIANRTIGSQGQTIARLRGELREMREEDAEIERGELRRLQRFEQTCVCAFARDKDRLDRAYEEIKRLRKAYEDLAVSDPKLQEPSRLGPTLINGPLG